MAKTGDYVRIESVVLTPEQRAPQVPDDTKKVPLELWVRGFVTADAEVGEEVEIKTITGRMVKGTLVEENPTYRHSFGEHVPEIYQIGLQLKEILFAEDK